MFPGAATADRPELMAVPPTVCAALHADEDRFVIMNSPLEHTWETFGGTLKRFIRARVADDLTADDLLQDVFLKIHTHIDTLSDAGRLEPWIYQITRNVITDYYRRARPRAEVREMLPALPDGHDDHALRTMAPCLRPLIEQLPAAYREALLLTEYEGLTQQALAQRTGISLSGAKSRVQRGRERLKGLLLACCHVHFDHAGRLAGYEPQHGACVPSTCAPRVAAGDARAGTAGPSPATAGACKPVARSGSSGT